MIDKCLSRYKKRRGALRVVHFFKGLLRFCVFNKFFDFRVFVRYSLLHLLECMAPMYVVRVDICYFSFFFFYLGYLLASSCLEEGEKDEGWRILKGRMRKRMCKATPIIGVSTIVRELGPPKLAILSLMLLHAS